MSKLDDFDAALRGDYPLLCGVDEAGRGPLAGPVCCAAVILRPDDPIEGLNDSKKLSAKKREALYPLITERALAWQVVFVDEATIDRINILQATMQGMRQAVEGLSVTPDYILIDGNRCPSGLPAAHRAVIGGDAASASIAAASILAKVTRDRYMCRLAQQYPQYALEKHKGYGTRLHYERIAQYGLQPFHRRSFLKKVIEQDVQMEEEAGTGTRAENLS